MNKMTKKLTLKDQTVAAAKAAEIKGGPIYMQTGLLVPAVQPQLIGLLLPAVQKAH